VVGVHGDADGRTDLERQLLVAEGPVEQQSDQLGDADGGIDVGDLRQQDPELVTAEPGDDAFVLEVLLEAGADLLEQDVAVVVAERVVHLLEAVEVHQHDGRPAP
jgi:hypothetical protein